MLGYTPACLLNQAHLPGQDQPNQLRLCWARAGQKKSHFHHGLQTAFMSGQLDKFVKEDAMALLMQAHLAAAGHCLPQLLPLQLPPLVSLCVPSEAASSCLQH